MKKIILTVAAAFALSFANAQDLKSKKGENYLPEAGDWAIGFNADGLFNYVGNAFNHTTNNAPSVTFQQGGTFVGKKFISATEAYRVVANLSIGGSTTGDATSTAGQLKTSGFDLYAGLGKEWRKGKTRLQGFYGADLFLKFSNSKVTNTNSFVGSPDFVQTTKNGSFGLGANGFIGAEYFLFPKISIGAQYTYGLVISSTSPTKVSTTGLPDTESGKASSFGLGGVGVSSINMTLHF